MQDGNINEAKKYISSLTTIFKSQKSTEYNDNYMLGALLTEKCRKAEELKTEIIKDIHVDRKLNIDNKDWCIILGNALDNAIEALEKVEISKRLLEIIIKNINNILSIKIKNKMIGDLITDGALYKTTKADKHVHGLGLKNINNCIKKYSGEMKIDIDHDEFTLVIVLLNV